MIIMTINDAKRMTTNDAAKPQMTTNDAKHNDNKWRRKAANDNLKETKKNENHQK